MTVPLPGLAFLSGTPTGGQAVSLPCQLLSAPKRTLGLFGDSIQVAVKASAWPVAGWVVGSEAAYTITFGVGADVVQLGGYALVNAAPGSFGFAVTPQTDGEPPEPPSGNAEAQTIILTLVTKPGRWRDARGGAIRAKVFNPVKPSGAIDTDHADYRTNSQLLTLAFGSIGLPLEALPASLDQAQPPAAIDWSFARPIPEVESLLARAGHAATLTNDGAKFRVVRLPLGGESPTIPQSALDRAEPHALTASPAVRGSVFVVTSGKTRTIALTWRTLEDLEWVWFDEATGLWLNAQQTATLYPNTPAPDDIAALRAGPGRSAKDRAHFQRLFRAVRLKGDDLLTARRFIPLPPSSGATIDVGGASVALGASAAVGLVQGAFEISPNVFRNEPDVITGPHTIVSARAHPGEGVISFDHPLFYVSPGQQGGYGNAQKLQGDALKVVFAFEVDSGDFFTDTFTRGFKLDQNGTLVEMTQQQTDQALYLPDTVVVEAPFLRRLIVWPRGQETFTTLNAAELTAIATTLARARVGRDQAISGVVPLRGLRDVTPGDWGGAVSSVAWSIENALTLVGVNEHEISGSAIDELELQAGRSLASGLSRFTLPGSAVALSDVRSGSNEDAGGAGPSLAPRGREAASGSRPVLEAPPRVAPVASRWFARVTGASSVGPNRWSYQWTEVAPGETPGSFTDVPNGRTHASHGPLYPGVEAYNSAAGVQGNGVNRANLPQGWTMQPIANQVLEVAGPFGPETTKWCVAVGVTNADDGQCASGTEGADAPTAPDDGCRCGCGGRETFGPAATGIDEAFLMASAAGAWGGSS